MEEGNKNKVDELQKKFHFHVSSIYDDSYQSVEEKKKTEELKKLELENLSSEQDIKQRKEFAGRIFNLTLYYLFTVALFLFLSASPNSFEISDTVLVTLLGTTTSTVLGMFYFVAKYLFSRPNKKTE